MKNTTNLLLALAVIICIATGCKMFNKDDAGNSTISSSNNSKVTTNSTTTTTNSTTSTTKMPSGKAISWGLANKLSTAAILYDLKGDETSDSLSKAKILAEEVGATVPSFPSKTGDKIKDRAAVMGYLLNDVNKDMGSKVKSKYGTPEAALFEMSLKSNVLLLIYGPGDSTGKAVSKMIRTNAKIADLPENLWMPVVNKIENDGSFDDVKDAILEMQSDVGDYLNK